VDHKIIGTYSVMQYFFMYWHAQYVNLEVPAYFLKAKKDILPEIKEKDKWIFSILVSAGTQLRSKKKFRYGILACTGPFRTL
jgi:hypothetical protein